MSTGQEKKGKKNVRFVKSKDSFESNLSNASNPDDPKFQGTKNAGKAIQHASGSSDKKPSKKNKQGKTF
jgi:hypothetical protein